MSIIPIDFDSCLKNHLYHYEIYSKVDGEVANYHPPYCIQVKLSIESFRIPNCERRLLCS